MNENNKVNYLSDFFLQLVYVFIYSTAHCVVDCMYWELLLTNEHWYFFSKLYHVNKWCAKCVRNIVRTIVSFLHNQFSQEPLDNSEGLNKRETVGLLEG